MRQSYTKDEVQRLRINIRKFLEGLGGSGELTEAESKLVPKLLTAQLALNDYMEVCK